MQHPFTNRLINETSPYLLQHAHNPVDWYPWGEEALSKAKSDQKVILVSIGYSACHWCHVMERESFEQEAVASLMNEYFVNIKIDREERPDLDHIYMDAVQAMAGSGGWPLNVFLTPEAKPFFGGTYFPPVRAYNMSSWTEVLEGIARAWKDRKSEVEAQAENLVEHLQHAGDLGQFRNNITDAGLQPLITMEQCDEMFAAIMKSADRKWGGFGKAPKFPQTFTIAYLIQYYYFTGKEEALKQALLSLDKMLQGGIYDHIGGGLARYSTDAEWLAPHFEKMLYDNALLINILCDAYQVTRQEKYERAIRKTIAFVTAELLDASGGFYAALDADSEGEEGKYYVWEKEEVDAALGEDAELFCSFFDVSVAGNWEGTNILRMLTPPEEFAAARHMEEGKLMQILEHGLERLSLIREKRVKPGLDDKMILAWNALMLKAIARAATVLKDESYKQLAEANFNFISRNFRKDDTGAALLHTFKNGVAKYPAFLDDYAYLVAACIQLYKMTFDEAYLKASYDYCEYITEYFSDEESVFFYFTHRDQKDVIVRKKEIYDGATPSGNSVMAENLYQLGLLFDRSDWRGRADKMLESLSQTVIKYPGSFGIWAGLLHQQLAGMNEVAVVGAGFMEVSEKIMLNFIPNLVIMSAAKENRQYPLLADKPDTASTLIYLCKNYACSAPFQQPDLLPGKIAERNKITT